MHSDLKHNNLEINNLPPPIDGGKENDFTYSANVAKLLRRFVRLAMPDSFINTWRDIELLDDVMRYGSLTVIAQKKGCSVSSLSYRLGRVLNRLEERVAQCEAYVSDAQAYADLERQLAEVQQRNGQLEQELKQQQEHIEALKRKLDVSSSINQDLLVDLNNLRDKGIRQLMSHRTGSQSV